MHAERRKKALNLPESLTYTVASDAPIDGKEPVGDVVQKLSLSTWCAGFHSGGGHAPTITNVSESGGDAEVLLVVPTLGQRLGYLRETLLSVRAQSVPVDVVIVAPSQASRVTDLAKEFRADVIDDPGGLPEAINLGVSKGLVRHDFVNWLNDDDVLEPGSLKSTIDALHSNSSAVVAFGACRYIDSHGSELWTSRAGRWAPRILAWGPDLIPQPGMLVRAWAWKEVGGLDSSYRLAFDLDLLLKLKKQGSFIDTGQVVSSFRWHPDSLTVDDRTRNIAESERAKRAALGPVARRLAWVWEGPVRMATRVAAREVNRRAMKASTR